jgi:glycosyltransferase involved in cell wall biosynthesis
MPPLVSIILPVYNGATYLQQTLDSIKAQTLTNWELIAIDDGSKDDSGKILRDFAASEPRTRIISRENRGLIATLNEGVQAARGTWIARIDADDICLPERLEKQIAWAEKQQADLCGGIIERIGIDAGHSWVFPASTQGTYAWLLFRSAFAHPTIIIKRELALKFPYSADFLHAEDYELWTRLALAGVPMTNIPERVLRYRVHEEQVSTAKKDAQTDTRVRVTRNYWQKSPLVRDMPFFACLVDERQSISRDEFIAITAQLHRLYQQLDDVEAKAAVRQHLTWFIYRSLHLDGRTVFRTLRPLPVSNLKKTLITLICVLNAGFVVNYCRNASWVRWFPLKWFF